MFPCSDEVDMERTRSSRAFRGWHLQSLLSKQPGWLWKWWLLMVLVLFLMTQGRKGAWSEVQEDHREEGGGPETSSSSSPSPPRQQKSSSSTESVHQPVVDQTVDLIDNLVKTSGSDSVKQNYLLVKSMLSLWNPEASKWAQRASAKYR